MPGNKPSILIVENDYSTLELYCRALEYEYHPLGTINHADALKLANQPDLQAVVLEPEMNDRRGWELMDEIRQVLFDQSIPIILCSSSDERRRGLKLGAAAYLVKPVMPSELIEVIRNLLDNPHSD